MIALPPKSGNENKSRKSRATFLRGKISMRAHSHKMRQEMSRIIEKYLRSSR
jgi:hypothetical protein